MSPMVPFVTEHVWQELIKPVETDAGKAARNPVVLRVVWDGASAQIIGIDKETVY